MTGTDTGCGKTYVAVALIRALKARGLRAVGYKPVAAGAEPRDGALRNADALALMAASAIDMPYAAVNPYCFEPAVAPHIAAAEAGSPIDLGRLLTAAAELAARADFTLVEGAGGWLVPLGAGLDMQGLALALGLPVVLVVGLRLGCLSHALLSERAILGSGATGLGWVGSVVDPTMPRLTENIETLKEHLSLSCLGILPHAHNPDAVWPGGDAVLDRLLEPAG